MKHNMYKYLLGVLLLVGISFNVVAQSPKVNDINVNNKANFTPKAPEPEGQRVRGELYYNDLDGSFHNYDGTIDYAIGSILEKQITSANILAGDSVQLLPQSGSDYFYRITDVVVEYVGTGTTAYTSAATDTIKIKMYSQGEATALFTIDDLTLTTAKDSNPSNSGPSDCDWNSSVWLDIPNQFTNGTGYFWITFEYKKYKKHAR